ncbi:SIS domain-containing protein [Brevibacillus daliensis]|uniref:SIS domain-containing protein n=1 Tax=Brevibacillus daliensis TaxID=2892995 RepID=UPI001E3E51A6|nr:SIS domain-containing protein [Brevibacillus daliensis]
MLLGKEETYWKEHGATHTAKEIVQQPQLWRETFEIIKNQSGEIDQFFERIFSKHARVRVILTGAGTSAFIGETVTPYLYTITDETKMQIESIPTTSIVSNPMNYLKHDEPTIIISFARSGNSPESVATINLGEQIVSDIYHIFVTCNPEGSLAKWAENRDNALVLMMPSKSNDKGFAMTGSFTCMMLGVLLTFERNRLENMEDIISYIISRGEEVIGKKESLLDPLAESSFSRLVYLGSGALGGLAREATLKLLELTGGNIPIMFDTPLGFRHGPKSIIDEETVVIVMLSNDRYTRKYDLDILREIRQEKTKALVAISDVFDPQAESMSDLFLCLQEPGNNNELDSINDCYLAIPVILFAQILALKKSLALGISPDNPCPSGSVNRVVQGVTIYDYEK